MKIAFFTDTFLPNVDGVVTSILNYRRELQKRHNDVFVFSSGDSLAKKINKDPSVFFYRSVKFPPYPQYKIALFPYSSARKVKQLDVDIVHCHAMASMGLASIAAAKYCKTPLVGTFHTMLPMATAYFTKEGFTRRFATKAAWRAVKAFYSPFDLVTSPSKAVQGLLSENNVESVVLSNAVDTLRFRPIANYADFKQALCGDKKLVLVAGRLGLEKNVDVVLKAFSKIDSDAMLVVTGEGPAKKKCQKLAFELGIADRVKFVGFVDSSMLPLYYNSADCFVTASTFETQGLALLEAMGCGAITIGANALAIPECLKDNKNGFLFTPGDVFECKEKIEKALSLPENSRKKISLAARKEAEKHSVEKTTDELFGLYKKLL